MDEEEVTKLNDSKIDLLIMGSSNQLQILTSNTIKIGDENISGSASAHNIGAIFDRTVSMKEQEHAIAIYTILAVWEEVSPRKQLSV